MSSLLKTVSLSLLLAAGVSATAVAKPQFRQVENVRVGASKAFNAIGSFSDGTAVVLTSPTTRHKSFSLSKVVEQRIVKIADFSAKLMSLKSSSYSIRDVAIKIDRKANIIVIFSLYATSEVDGLELGMELQVAIFDKNGRLKYSKFVDSSAPRSHIGEINIDVLPGGNLLSVYNISNKKVKASRERLYVNDVHMALMKPSGSVISLQQVSVAADHQPAGDGRLTSDALREGHNVAVAPSGDFRIVWSHGRVSKDGEYYGATGAARYSVSGQRKNVEYFDDTSGLGIVSASTFYRNDKVFSDAVVNYRLDQSDYLAQIFRVRAPGKRRLINQRGTGFDEGAWYGATQFEDKYALYVHQKADLNCYLSGVNLNTGNALVPQQITSGRLAHRCSGGVVTNLADDSIGVLTKITNEEGVEAYFFRYKDL